MHATAIRIRRNNGQQLIAVPDRSGRPFHWVYTLEAARKSKETGEKAKAVYKMVETVAGNALIWIDDDVNSRIVCLLEVTETWKGQILTEKVKYASNYFGDIAKTAGEWGGHHEVDRMLGLI